MVKKINNEKEIKLCQKEIRLAHQKILLGREMAGVKEKEIILEQKRGLARRQEADKALVKVSVKLK